MFDTLEYTCACTQRVKLITRAYLTPPTIVTRPHCGTVTRRCIPPKSSTPNKYLSTSSWIVQLLNHVISMRLSSTFDHLRIFLAFSVIDISHANLFCPMSMGVVLRELPYSSKIYILFSPLSITVVVHCTYFLRLHVFVSRIAKCSSHVVNTKFDSVYKLFTNEPANHWMHPSSNLYSLFSWMAQKPHLFIYE